MDFIEIASHHSSCRDFTAEPVSEADRAGILAAARACSTSCMLQVTSIIRITDQAKKEKIAELCGPQPHIARAPEVWIFCADYHRNARLIQSPDYGWTEQLLVGIMDTAIMAQTAFCALESLGLGGVYAGGIRNHIEEIDELLGLPQYVFPVVGVVFGHPASVAGVKPKLPASVLMSENVYREPADEELADYERVLNHYYRNRPLNPRDTHWRDDLERILLRERRQGLLAYLQKKGFALK